MKQFKLIKSGDITDEILCISDITLSIIEEQNLTVKEVIYSIIAKAKVLSDIKTIDIIKEQDFVEQKKINWEIIFDQCSKQFAFF